jgi:hypothetical protein
VAWGHRGKKGERQTSERQRDCTLRIRTAGNPKGRNKKGSMKGSRKGDSSLRDKVGKEVERELKNI